MKFSYSARFFNLPNPLRNFRKFLADGFSHVFVAIAAESLVATKKTEGKIFKCLEMVEKKSCSLLQRGNTEITIGIL